MQKNHLAFSQWHKIYLFSANKSLKIENHTEFVCLVPNDYVFVVFSQGCIPVELRNDTDRTKTSGNNLQDHFKAHHIIKIMN